MKSSRILNVAVFCALIFLMYMNGCKYDVAEPIWEEPFTVPVTPVIMEVIPDQAIAGVNIITIVGENFDPDSNIVYFDNTTAEVLNSSPTSITVRRPNVETDSATIKVVSNKALMAVKYAPYNVEKVFEQYGNFLENAPLSALVVDNQENLFVIEARNVYKVTPDGIKVSPDGSEGVFTVANRSTTDAKIGPDGNLYLMGTNRAVDKVDLTTGAVSRWTQLPSGKIVKYGDFDDSGFFYCGGNKTDLVVVASDLTVKPYSGYYSGDEIYSIRYYNNYIYVVSNKTGTQEPVKIWRHQIDASGNLGSQELVLDWSTTGDLSSRSLKSLTFSTSGIMYLATDAVNPILTYNPANNTIDYLYKEILHPYCKNFAWGSGNYLYMINGDAATGEVWTVYRVNAGVTGIQ